jgi:hypothetical protein
MKLSNRWHETDLLLEVILIHIVHRLSRIGRSYINIRKNGTVGCLMHTPNIYFWLHYCRQNKRLEYLVYVLGQISLFCLRSINVTEICTHLAFQLRKFSSSFPAKHMHTNILDMNKLNTSRNFRKCWVFCVFFFFGKSKIRCCTLHVCRAKNTPTRSFVSNFPWYMAFAWWLVPCLPFPGLPHIYFLFTSYLEFFMFAVMKTFVTDISASTGRKNGTSHHAKAIYQI